MLNKIPNTLYQIWPIIWLSRKFATLLACNDIVNSISLRLNLSTTTNQSASVRSLEFNKSWKFNSHFFLSMKIIGYFSISLLSVRLRNVFLFSIYESFKMNPPSLLDFHDLEILFSFSLICQILKVISLSLFEVLRLNISLFDLRGMHLFHPWLFSFFVEN